MNRLNSCYKIHIILKWCKFINIIWISDNLKFSVLMNNFFFKLFVIRTFYELRSVQYKLQLDSDLKQNCTILWLVCIRKNPVGDISDWNINANKNYINNKYYCNVCLCFGNITLILRKHKGLHRNKIAFHLLLPWNKNLHVVTRYSNGNL